MARPKRPVPAPEFPTLPDGARVLVDTAPLIYWFENHPLAVRFEPFFSAIEARGWEPIITPITLAELVVGPIKAGEDGAAERYRKVLTSPPWRLRETDAAIAMSAARLRISHALRLPDAIQMATALAEECVLLLTHDRDFPALPGLLTFVA